MLSRRTVRLYAEGVDSISDEAAAYIDDVLERAWGEGLTTAEMRELAIEAIMAASDECGGMTRELACSLYEQETGEVARYNAQSGVDREAVERSVRYQAGKLDGSDAGFRAFSESCQRQVRTLARRGVNEELIANCRTSKSGRSRYRHNGSGSVRFARVPQGGDTCTFCAMLASRGFVYWTRKTAGEFNHYHHNCRCLVVPDDGSGEVEGYDPGEWLRRWRDYEEIDADVEHSDKVKLAAKRLIANSSAVSADAALATASNLDGRVPPTSIDVPSWTSGRKFSEHARKHAAALGLDPTTGEGREAYDRLFSDTMDSWDAVAYDDDFGGQRPDECVFYFKGDTIAIVNVVTRRRVSLFKHESGISEHIDGIWDKAHSRP